MPELIWKSTCCRKGGCPEVAVDEEGFIYIKDDHDGQVKLTSDELDNILYILAKNEMEETSCEACSEGYYIHTFIDEYGIGDDEKMVEENTE